MNMGYSKQALSGFSWQTVLKFFTAGVTFVKIAILARLLSPNDFGIFSIVAIALGITEAVTQTGVNITLLQLKDNLKTYISSAWVIAIIRGFGMGIVMIGLGFLLSNYYNQPALLPLISVAAIIPIIKGFINPYIISMQRDFKFSQETRYFSFLQLLETSVAIGLAYFFQNAWIFIFAMIVSALVEVLISFLLFTERPSFRYQKEKGSVILKNTKHFSINALFSYLLENVDNMIVGKLLGTSSLGLYQNGYAVAHKANYDFAKSFHYGALPTFGKIIDDKERTRRGFLKLLATTAIVVLCASIPLLLFPRFLVELILGTQWLGLVPVIPYLTLAGIAQSIILIHYTVLFAYQKINFINAHLIISLIILIPFIIFGSNWAGLLGAAIGVLLSRLLSLPFLLYITYKTLR